MLSFIGMPPIIYSTYFTDTSNPTVIIVARIAHPYFIGYLLILDKHLGTILFQHTHLQFLDLSQHIFSDGRQPVHHFHYALQDAFQRNGGKGGAEEVDCHYCKVEQQEEFEVVVVG